MGNLPQQLQQVLCQQNLCQQVGAYVNAKVQIYRFANIAESLIN